MKAFYRLFYYISIVLTSILAGVTIAGAFVGNAAPDSFKFMPFIGLMLPILLLANLASVIYWTIRWRCWVFIPLIAIFSNWSYISCVIQSPFFSPASAPMVKMNAYTPGILTVATYNVDAFNHEHTGYSCKEIASYMRNLQADILCFQEFGINDEFGVDSIAAVLSDWPYYYIPISPEGKHLLQLAVFSRYPIKEENLIVYPDSKNCSLWCDIETNARTIRLFNNHLQTTEVSQNKRKLEKGLHTDDSQRVERAALGLIDGLHENFRKRAVQANTLKQLIAASPYPTIICGDFNSLPSSYVYHTVKGDKLQDGFQTSGHGYMYTFKFFKHLLRIDYILHSPELNSTDYFSPDLTVLGEVASPGSFVVSNEKINLLEALAMAGDLTIYGMRDNVKLIRTEQNNKQEIITMDLNKAETVLSPYYQLQQNDIIYVTPNKTKAKNSDIGAGTGLWFSGVSILLSITNFVLTILR